MSRLTQLPEVLETRGIGDNNPPEEIGALPLEGDGASLALDQEGWSKHIQGILAPSAERVAAMTAQLDSILTQYPLTKPGITGGKPGGVEKWDDEVAGRLADIREDFRSVMKTVLALHGLEKEPVLRASKAIDGAKNALVDKIVITDSKGKIQPGAAAPINRIVDCGTWYTDWINAERLRIQKEEAARKQQEADEAAALAMKTDAPEALDRAEQAFQEAEQAEAAVNAPVAERTRVRGSYGGVMSSRTTWQFVESESKLSDLAAAALKDPHLLKYLQFNTARIGIAVRSEKVREIPGCAIKEVRSV